MITTICTYSATLSQCNILYLDFSFSELELISKPHTCTYKILKHDPCSHYKHAAAFRLHNIIA